MIALTDRLKVTPACQPWCAEHRPTADGSLGHLSPVVSWERSEGEQVSVQLDTLEAADGIFGPRIYLTQDGVDDALSLDDARTLADALNELIAAAEVTR
ncbi:MAG: hypothetical protein Q7T56_07385 [Nocardioidaceae bacterium]|nr:hypothetical protein [Nocardioidaceae bacterium]